jgi:hypothetical protein
MLLTVLFLIGISTLASVSSALAEWSAQGEGILYYTDDVALFSATRRSNIDGDPTQPVLDVSRTGFGSDMVFEPGALISNAITTGLGRTAFSIKPQGFVYAVNPEFSQASVAVEALHSFTPNTALRLRYYTAPDQLLGSIDKHEGEHEGETGTLADVRLTSHIGYIRLEQRLSDHWEFRLQGRVGKRIYNDAFSMLNTTFWTIGPHIFWRATDHVKFFVAYHYERGLNTGRLAFEAEGDVSYVHHFFAVGCDAELMPHLELELDFHYERNNFTSGIPEDERNDGHENIFLGNGRLLYKLTNQTALTLSVQRANRKQNFHQTHDHNTNIGVGVIHRF